jgi:hypothetical protein
MHDSVEGMGTSMGSSQYNGFTRFLNDANSDENNFMSYRQDQVVSDVTEVDLLNSNHVPKVMSSHLFETEIPAECNNHVLIFTKFGLYEVQNVVDIYSKLRQGVIINFKSNEIIMGLVPKSTKFKQQFLEIIGIVEGRIGTYLDHMDEFDLMNKKKLRKETMRSYEKMQEKEPNRGGILNFRVLEENNDSNTDDDIFEDEIIKGRKNFNRRMSDLNLNYTRVQKRRNAHSLDEKATQDLLSEPNNDKKAKDDFFLQNTKKGESSDHLESKLRESMNILYSQIENKTRQRALKIFRFNQAKSKDGEVAPSISLDGILDSEKRYFPITFVEPVLRNCSIDVKVKYEFDRYYDSSESTTDFGLFGDKNKSFKTELLNKYRENELILKRKQEGRDKRFSTNFKSKAN